MKPVPVLIAVLALGATGTGLVLWKQQGARAERVEDYLVHGSDLERGGRTGEAIEVYRAALQLELTPAERAEVRYRLARTMISGNDLNGAMGVLADLTEEDVAEQRIDITPLYLELGDRAMDAGNERLAKLAYRSGQALALTPQRVTDFAGRLERFIRPPEEPAEDGSD